GPEAATAVAIAGLADRDGVAGSGESCTLLLYPHQSELRLAWKVVVSAGLAYRQ
ncbi:MAG: hypothetical protein GY953_49220, partial [bacterium]|nr:hypothetical protein [bacterium]